MLKQPLWEMLVGFYSETYPIFWSGPRGMLVLEQRQPGTGDQGRRRVQGEQSRIIIARVSPGPGPPSCLLPGGGWDRTNPAPSLWDSGIPAVKPLVAAGDRSLFLSTPAQLGASTGFDVPLTAPGDPRLPAGFTCLSMVLLVG